MFFEDIVGELFSTEQITLVKSDSEKEQSTVSVNDQSILFYIAGFIIKALKKGYYLVTSKNLTIIDKLVSHSDPSSFVTSYSEWFNKQDRGGLQKPSDNLFLLMRELENIVRKSISDRYCSSSLTLVPLKESIMESYMVKHYADNIFKGENCANVSKITEDVVHLFLTIPGYAVTRVERNIITTNSSRVSSSLCQVLKENV